MNLNLFLSYCDVDVNHIILVCYGCGHEYTYSEFFEENDPNQYFVRSIGICPFEDSFNLMVVIK